MILGISDSPTTHPAAPRASAKESVVHEQQDGAKVTSTSCMPLQTLVDIASTLFDQSNLMERNLELENREELQQQQQRHQLGMEEEKDSPQQEARSQAIDTARFEEMKREVSTSSVPNPHKTEVSTFSLPNPPKAANRLASITYENEIKKMNRSSLVVPLTNTREGFLAKLRSVLNDPSQSDVLSWMPDGEAFTIISSRKFAKTGMIYDLFGIRKMSSFLRRLNQLGFARVRDPTDLQNLDVFRKPGFSASSVQADALSVTTRSTTTTTTTAKAIAPKEAQHLDSPTSTLLFSQMIATTGEKKEKDADQHQILTPVASSSSMITLSTPTMSSNDSTGSSLSSSTTSPQPPTRDRLHFIPPFVVASHRSNSQPNVSLSSMPPSIPSASTGAGDPVSLRPRGESFEDSISTIMSTTSTPISSPVAAPLCPNSKTPTITNKRTLLSFSPGTLQNLKVPKLQHANPTTELRPPPLQFVADCVERLVNHPGERPTPMDVEPKEVETRCEDLQTRHRTQRLGRIDFQELVKIQHYREYLYLYGAAEYEADCILNGGTNTMKNLLTPAHTDVESREAPCRGVLPYEASVLVNVELQRGYNARLPPYLSE